MLHLYDKWKQTAFLSGPYTTATVTATQEKSFIAA